jgi:hypothetical protein
MTDAAQTAPGSRQGGAGPAVGGDLHQAAHNPNNLAKAFKGKSRLGNYSDSVLELDSDIGRIMDTIRTEAPDTIVIVTAGAHEMMSHLDVWPTTAAMVGLTPPAPLHFVR